MASANYFSSSQFAPWPRLAIGLMVSFLEEQGDHSSITRAVIDALGY